MGDFMVSSERIQELGKLASLDHYFFGAEMVPVSGVLQPSTKTPRFRAILDTVRASYEAGLRHLIMLDSDSDPAASKQIEDAGGVVVNIDHETEGGLARPYVIAAQLIDCFAPTAVMAKFEGEKPLFEGVQGRRNMRVLIDAGRRYDILTGVRSASTWRSMPQFQVATEIPLGATIGQILEVSADTPSGVIAFSAAGRRLFMEYTDDNSWPYLFQMPFWGRRTRKLKVGEVTVDFSYHPAVVEEETGNPTIDQKRIDQVDKMLSSALKLLGTEGSLRAEDTAAVSQLRLQRDALAAIAQLVAV